MIPGMMGYVYWDIHMGCAREMHRGAGFSSIAPFPSGVIAGVSFLFVVFPINPFLSCFCFLDVSMFLPIPCNFLFLLGFFLVGDGYL